MLLLGTSAIATFPKPGNTWQHPKSHYDTNMGSLRWAASAKYPKTRANLNYESDFAFKIFIVKMILKINPEIVINK